MDFSLTKEQRDIKRAAAKFARGEFDTELAQDCDLNHRFPAELYRKAGELGFIGLDMAPEIGGGGLGVIENALVVEEFCKADSGLGMALHLAFLPAKLVKLFGTRKQQEKCLSPLTRGEAVSAVSFTESDHGSDLRRMNTTLEEKDDGFVLNGTKMFTTNAAYADFFVVLAQEDPEARPGKGMTTVLVEKDPGTWLEGELEILEIPNKMGIRMTSSGELVFHHLKVSKESLLGERGRGLMNVLDFLDESRIEIAAQALGNAEGAFLKALEHARERTQFDTPIIDFQAIGHRLAEMWSQIQSLKLMTYYAAWMCDRKPKKMAKNIPMYTSMVKYYVPVKAKEIIDECITIFGGYGYFLEQEVERRYRDNRIVEMYEGTVQVQLNNIVRILKRQNMEHIRSSLV